MPHHFFTHTLYSTFFLPLFPYLSIFFPSRFSLPSFFLLLFFLFSFLPFLPSFLLSSPFLLNSFLTVCACFYPTLSITNLIACLLPTSVRRSWSEVGRGQAALHFNNINRIREKQAHTALYSQYWGQYRGRNEPKTR